MATRAKSTKRQAQPKAAAVAQLEQTYPARQGEPESTFSWNDNGELHEGSTGVDGVFQPINPSDVAYADSRGWPELEAKAQTPSPTPSQTAVGAPTASEPPAIPNAQDGPDAAASGSDAQTTSNDQSSPEQGVGTPDA